MSDPVTNAEVEDVLSSIRRLVSEEKRPLQPAKQASQNDRLVLTPALRVAEPEATQDAEPEMDNFEFEDAPDYDFDAYSTDSSARDASEDEALYDDPYEHAGDDVAAAETGFEDEDNDDDAQPEMQASVERHEDDYETDPYNFDDEEDEVGHDDAPMTLSAQARAEPEWEDDTLELDDLVALEDAVDDAPSTPPTHAEIAAADTKAATLSAKIEALESAIGGTEDEFEPDEAGTNAYSGTEPPAMAWEDDLDEDAADASDIDLDQISQTIAQDAAETVEETVMAAATAPQDEDQPFAFASDEQTIDEEALRDLVSDIVRAELQGALGERITRNVRKLVRREIHRALTAQDLE